MNPKMVKLSIVIKIQKNLSLESDNDDALIDNDNVPKDNGTETNNDVNIVDNGPDQPNGSEDE